MTELETYIHNLFEIRQENLTNTAQLFEFETLEKGSYFARPGYVCHKLSFIRSGYVRVYNSFEGKEITQYISSQGEFITDLASLVFEKPARWHIQTLTECELYSINRSNYRKIGEIVPEWKELEKMFLAKCFLFMEDRIFSFLSMNAEQRFKMLFEQKPGIFNAVPLHFLASMLGITPETLSRIRKNMIS